MCDTSGTPPQGASWDDLCSELFDAEDQAEIERRAEHLRAEVRAYRLAEVRKRQHTTQVELAQRLGVSQARVADIERGQLTRSDHAHNATVPAASE